MAFAKEEQEIDTVVVVIENSGCPGGSYSVEAAHHLKWLAQK
jgi:hypothetical protein